MRMELMRRRPPLAEAERAFNAGVQGVSNHAWQRWAGALSPPLAVGVSSLGVTPVGLGTCVYGLAAMVVGGTRGSSVGTFASSTAPTRCRETRRPAATAF